MRIKEIEQRKNRNRRWCYRPFIEYDIHTRVYVNPVLLTAQCVNWFFYSLSFCFCFIELSYILFFDSQYMCERFFLRRLRHFTSFHRVFSVGHCAFFSFKRKRIIFLSFSLSLPVHIQLALLLLPFFVFSFSCSRSSLTHTTARFIWVI